MTLTIGRITLDDPTSWSESGRSLSLSGWIKPDSSLDDDANAATLQAVTGQLVGLWDNPDEDVYPLTWSLEPSVDGYYTLTGAPTVSRVNTGATRAVAAQWSLSLERVEQPMFETFSTIVLRTNSHTITGTPDTVVAVYPESIGFERSFGGAAAQSSFPSRSTPDGNISLIDPSAAGSYPTTATTAVSIPAAHYYRGRPTIEVMGEDSVWRPVHGRLTPVGAQGAWRITNGCTRVRPGTTAGHLAIDVYVAGTWETSEFKFGYYSAGFVLGYVGYDPTTGQHFVPTIIRNGPDEVTIRFNASLYLDASCTTDITLTAGSRLVIVSGTGTASRKWAVAASTAAAATALTGGLGQTSGDANGNRWKIFNAETSTNDTTDGYRYLTSAATKHCFGLCIEINGASATSPDTSSMMADQFYGAAVMSTRAIAR